MEDLTGGIELYIPPVIKLSDPNPKLIILTLILIKNNFEIRKNGQKPQNIKFGYVARVRCVVARMRLIFH